MTNVSKNEEDGSLLAVSTSDNGFKILANADGLRMLQRYENRALDASRVPPDPVSKVAPGNALAIVNSTAGPIAVGTERGSASVSMSGLNGDTRSIGDVKVRMTEESIEKKSWKLTEIAEPSQCQSLKLPDNLPAGSIMSATPLARQLLVFILHYGNLLVVYS
jgi:hypothetical protein